jgi:hypothetical protein
MTSVGRLHIVGIVGAEIGTALDADGRVTVDTFDAAAPFGRAFTGG